ncbi:LysR family transcriptional regulator [Capsulimonas corticalis]|uniref:LysR family transcriptional regulator n=1 Tax=Capsulimonas corticalis TaxID=2219043 RepID=A0A402CV52_9BACT|nr:LysR substrate-binding domain-containing protein [Capsulimonas corticalis]BDI30277.1 LysR family transcriptional regulator [Capsulimonas corticalis]
MELRHLNYFVAVAEELHFGRAAERLFMAQPPLSRQIQQLEAELGVALFTREKKRVGLTPAGAVFLGEARAALARVDEAMEAARKAGRGERGRLRVGAATAAVCGLLPAATQLFRERFPEVDLSLSEMCSGQQPREVLERRLDIGLIMPSAEIPGMAAEIIRTEALMAILPQGHPLASHAVLSLADLSDEPFVLFPEHMGPALYQKIVDLCQAAGFTPKIAQEATPHGTLLAMVGAGAGVSLAPASLEGSSPQNVVFCRLEEAPPVELAAIWRMGDAPAAAARFLEVLRDTVESAKPAR